MINGIIIMRDGLLAILVLTIFSLGIITILYLNNRLPAFSIPYQLYDLLFTLIGFIIIVAIMFAVIKKLAD
jgi:prolipoprotein diacylglyceryltransferase